MLIIVEGPDGAGKTTLCDDLEKAIRTDPRTRNHVVTRLRAGPPRNHPLTEYEGPLLRYRPVSDRHVICDRWHLGEAVYPAVLARPTEMTPAVYRHIALFLQARGAVTVVLHPPVNKLRDVIETRGDELITPTMIAHISRRYHELPSELIPNLQYETWPYDVSSILSFARLFEYQAVWLRDFVTYVGSPRPELLLMGDVRGVDGRYQHTRNPAFMPYASTCGAFMLRHLERHRVGIANACDVDAPRELWHEVKRPPTVALGLKAHRRLTELGVPHGAVPHPQYVRRFHARSGTRYAELIGDAATFGRDLLRADLS